MRDSIKKLLMVEIFMLIVIISTFFQPYLFKDYKYLIFLLAVGIISYFFIGLDTTRMPNSKRILKSTLLVLLLYFFISYFSGFFIGFARTIYSWSFTNLVKNIIPTITIVLVCELLRYQLIKKSDNNKIVIALSFLSFVFLDMSLGLYNYNLSFQDELYEFIGLITLGSISKNLLMTIYDVRGDYVNSITYRLIMELYVYIITVVPDLGIYVESVIRIIIPIIISFIVINMKEKTLDKPKSKKKTNIIYYIIFLILLFLVLLNSGFLKYQTLVIGSDSMRPKIKKGDVVLIKKLKGDEIKNIKVGDILVFRKEGKLISHRVNNILEKNGLIFFVTKGDNNNQIDAGLVTEQEIIGIVKICIKSIGLPSVWLNEAFS